MIMGNRAVITTKQGWTSKENNLGIYLHWNGGRDSVEAFLTYCKMKGYRSPEKDNYGWASLAAVITNFFGASGDSIGIDIVTRLDCDNWNNGVYIIEDWQIVDRQRFKGREQQEHNLEEFLMDIDNSMPEGARFGEEFLSASIVPVDEVEIGDMVFVQEVGGKFEKYEVLGFGADEYVNGHKAKGVPYVKRYMNDGVYTSNPNNYIWGDTVRVAKKGTTYIESESE